MKLEITRRAELAVRALALLNRTGERFGAAELADALGTTVERVRALSSTAMSSVDPFPRDPVPA